MDCNRIFIILTLSFYIMPNFCMKSINQIIVTFDSKQGIPRDARYALGEVAAYNADQKLNLNLVTKTTLSESKTKKNHTVLTVQQQKVTPKKYVKFSSHNALQKLVKPNEYAGMNILHFLIGKYNRYRGQDDNMAGVIISGDGKLYLTENYDIAIIDKTILGYNKDKKISCPWIPIAQFSQQADQTQFSDVVSKKPTEDECKDMTVLAKHLKLDTWTQRDIASGNCRVWNGTLWRQIYVEHEDYVSAPFSETISTDLLDSIKALTQNDFKKMWPALLSLRRPSTQQYEELKTTFAVKSSERQDMLLKYFKDNPKNVTK